MFVVDFAHLFVDRTQVEGKGAPPWQKTKAR